MTQLAKLGGYNDHSGDSSITIYANIQAKSDAELLVFIENQMRGAGFERPDARALITGNLIDGEFTEEGEEDSTEAPGEV